MHKKKTQIVLWSLIFMTIIQFVLSVLEISDKLETMLFLIPVITSSIIVYEILHFKKKCSIEVICVCLIVCTLTVPLWQMALVLIFTGIMGRYSLLNTGPNKV